MGKGELDYNDPRVPPSVKMGRTGGVGEAGGQGDILESGFKGAAGTLPDKGDVSASVSETVSKAVGAGR